MMMTVTFDRPWSEQSAEVQNAISEEAYNATAKALGYNIEHKKTFIEKVLTSLAKYGIIKLQS